MSTILEIKNVTKTFGDEIIFKNVNLIVKYMRQEMQQKVLNRR